MAIIASILFIVLFVGVKALFEEVIKHSLVMEMGMTPQFNPHTLAHQRVAQLNQRFDKAMVYVLNALGMELVSYARERHTYIDRTGNLTNSMGYVVLKKGQQVAHGGETGGGEGEAAAMKLYSELAAGDRHDYSLIIVAGMEYAAYVEAKGYNVLMPAQLKADAEFSRRMKDLTARYDAKLKDMLK